jgi:hypothetical protein
MNESDKLITDRLEEVGFVRVDSSVDQFGNWTTLYRPKQSSSVEIILIQSRDLREFRVFGPTTLEERMTELGFCPGCLCLQVGLKVHKLNCPVKYPTKMCTTCGMNGTSVKEHHWACPKYKQGDNDENSTDNLDAGTQREDDSGMGQKE